MNSITEFRGEFSRSLRGYNAAEVDEAVEMLVSYGADLEAANAEFADANDWLTAENDRLSGELAALKEKVGDAGGLIADARKSAEQIIADAETEAARIRAERTAALERELADYAERCALEQRRYAALCRRTNELADRASALYRDQIAALDALAGAADPASPPPSPAERPAEKKEETAASPKKPIPRVRRSMMAAALVDAEEKTVAESAAEAEAVSAPTEEEISLELEQLPPPVMPPEPALEPEFAVIFSDDSPTRKAAESPVSPAEGASRVDRVYRTASPIDLKVTRDVPKTSGAQTHSFSAVRRSLEEIGSRLK